MKSKLRHLVSKLETILGRYRVPAAAVAVVLLAAGVLFVTGDSSGPERLGTEGPAELDLPSGETSSLEPGTTTATESAPGAAPTARRGSTSASSGQLAPKTLAAGGKVKVGLLANSGNPGEAFGLEVGADTEQFEKVAKAVVAEVNDQGGLGNRQIELIIQFVDQSDQSFENQARLHTEACTALTRDHKVFMVVNTADNIFHGAPCYVKASTPLLTSSVPREESEIRGFLPYLLPLIHPTSSRAAQLQLQSIIQSPGYMNKTMGVIAYDVPAGRQGVEEILIPGVAAAGGKIIDKQFIPPTYDGLATGISSAVVRFCGQNINRVISLQTNGPWYVFTKQAESQMCRPRYSLSTGDTPQSYIDQLPSGARPSPDQLDGSIGAGWWPTVDVVQESYPATDREKECWSIVNKRAGTQFSGRRDDGGSTELCQFWFILRDAFRPTAGQTLSGAQVIDHVYRLGSGFPAITIPKLKFAAGKLDASAVYARFEYQRSCDCYKYATGWIDV